MYQKHSFDTNKIPIIIPTILNTVLSIKGFIAYDCTGPKLNITTFNTLTVDFCKTPKPSKLKTS